MKKDSTEKSMERNEHFYRTEYDRLSNEVGMLRKTINELRNRVTKERKLLEEGPKSLAQAWHLQALKYRYESRNPTRNVED